MSTGRGRSSTNRGLRGIGETGHDLGQAARLLEVAEGALDEGVVLWRVRHVEERDHLLALEELRELAALVGAAVVEADHQSEAAALRSRAL